MLGDDVEGQGYEGPLTRTLLSFLLSLGAITVVPGVDMHGASRCTRLLTGVPA